MIAKRLVAVVVAVVLVAAALFVRERVIQPRASGADSGAAADTGSGGGGVPDVSGVDVICVREVESTCQALREAGASVRVASAGDTLSVLSQDQAPDADVWLTVAPWPEIAVQRREAAGHTNGVGPTSAVLARSPVVVVARSDRLEVLASNCGGTVTWTCIGEAASQRWQDVGGSEAWGAVKVSHADPDTTVEGLLAIAQAAAGFLDDVSFSRQDLEDARFFSWFSDLERSIVRPSTAGPVAQMVTQRATLDLVGTLEAIAAPLLETAQADGLEVLHLEPSVEADVVAFGLGPDGQQAVAAITEPATEALVDDGWEAPRPEDPGQGAGAGDARSPRANVSEGAASDNGLTAGALEALRETWRGAR